MHKKFVFRKIFLIPKTSKNVIFWPKNREKMAKSKILVEKFFWSESIQNALKRILKRKYQNRKFFLITKFFRWTQSFFNHNDLNRKKMTKSKILVEFFLVGIDSESFESYFKTKISNSKIFAVTNFFCDLVIFHLCGHVIEN